ncbi:hypothetical protein JVT61DRAFT_4153 [Boletus reticuloceps]|uniref:Phosphatidate phosphatase APP1 catalytic domain-containing protein n=1 Tax=Boletus reticuloceps TaxID=495285 RepID=A0A8I3A7N9_9AGAM|nr:hypothetical protein JVT61DRAFT_4153 [Boletus reticuloceps]
MTSPHSSRWAGIKNRISHRETRRSLPSQWATTPGDDNHAPRSVIQNWSQKIKRNSTDLATVDEVHLVPSWATKHPLRHAPPGEHENAFDIVLHVSGFATSRRTPEILTRSQRAFLRLARGFASIPKPQSITDIELQNLPELLHLPPRPYQIPDDYEVETLDAHFRNSGNYDHEDDIHLTHQLVPVDLIPAELARLHENLKSRLGLFWASSLPSRRILVSVFLQTSDPKYHGHSSGPLLTREILTGPDGHFSDTFRINWNDISTHPVGTHITSNQRHVERELLVEARIINMKRTPGLHETPTSTIRIPITDSVVRVISDIDDTVKVSKILEGTRAIFNQVFVKDLEDTIIPEMGEWYDTMWKHGVSFHYVSNSPFELLPLITQFISVSKLPRGSIRLRSYAGRSLFNGLLSAPGTRKRGNVVEVLDQFPESQFFLIGDSGEQDLELYSALAAERPSQIAGVFIRDVSAVGLKDPTGLKTDFGLTHSPMKPTRSKGTLPFPSSIPLRMVPKRAASDTDISHAHPGAIRIPIKKGSLPPPPPSLEPSPDSKASSLYRVSEDESLIPFDSGSPVFSNVHATNHVRPITEAEKRRCDLQNRVNKARLLMPSHVVLRVFEDPKECAEAEHIIQRFMDVN